MNAGYKIDIQKYDAFLYSNNKLSERETKKTIPVNNTSESKILSNKFNQDGVRPVP